MQLPVSAVARRIAARSRQIRYPFNIMLILASSSPRRRQLLQQAGVNFAVESADIDERLQPDETPAKYVQRLAVEKAQAVWERHRNDDNASDPILVLGADTAVVLDGNVLGKP